MFLLIATGVHVAIFIGFVETGQKGNDAPESAAPIVLQATDAELIAMVADWQTAPSVESRFKQPEQTMRPQQNPFETRTMPVRPMPQIPALPHASDRSLPQIDQSVIEQEKSTEDAEKAQDRPQRQASTQTRQGQQGGPAAQAARRAAIQEWGSRIRAQIARNQNLPSGVRKGTSATLVITVARSGALVQVGLAKSSGNGRFDRAALAAVKRAGRFPAAPDAITSSSETFTLPIRSR
ncbi:energy transducer TonB [Pseudaestuariivita rosea]|uniref:energy transducer TonB n=1 Tax=Pseudaestuariivita rosea TaxID=2763263 RepID=UPI001ABAF284|nr:TonB family protein [Pseudaestuariivita rosea]